jgi:hypothetical protein
MTKKICGWCGQKREIVGTVTVINNPNSMRVIACAECMAKEEESGKAIYPYDEGE